MLRAIGIGIVVLVVVLCAAGAVGYYKADQMIGISEAPQVGYEEVLAPTAVS